MKITYMLKHIRMSKPFSQWDITFGQDLKIYEITYSISKDYMVSKMTYMEVLLLDCFKKNQKRHVE